MADRVILDLWTFDVGMPAASLADLSEAVASRVESSWDSGADLVLFPEYTWMAIEPVIGIAATELGGLRNVAHHFWGEIYPSLSSRLCRPNKTVVLGTCPWFDNSARQFKNRAPILSCGRQFYQDKLRLTPWETAFTGGSQIHLWRSHGLTCAVLICLDIEIPEFSAALRGQGVDLILCPSATENVLGVERVDRCASARSVELCCHTAVSHLVGRCASSLIDQNVGRVAVYHPSQSTFLADPRWTEGAIEADGFHRLRVTIDPANLPATRALTTETNPSLQDFGKSIQQFPVVVV